MSFSTGVPFMRRILLPLLIVVLAVSAVFVLGQANVTPEAQSILQITISNSTCNMEVDGMISVTPEVTSEASSAAASIGATLKSPPYPLLTLGAGCADVIARLHVPNNDTIWIKFAVTENEPVWQQFKGVPGDAHPPKFDKRGRFVGCEIAQMGEQTCRALWAYEGTTYLIQIPLDVRSAYIAPIAATRTAAPAVSTAAPIPVSTPNSGVWGSCGSCTTCGGPVEHCVLAPDNTCVWDAARCEHRRPGDN
jgi:hypothetical protein